MEARHPLLLDKYRVWPNYDFTIAIEDSIDGVTHAFRSKEYELRNELYYSILDDLHMRKPLMLEFSRLELKGMPVSKRLLKQLIEEQKVSWYDDPRIPTLEAMKKRGITPQAIRKFILSLGFTKSDTLAPFDTLESFNRKIIDPSSIRLYMVENPKKLVVNNLPSSYVELANHPTNDTMGKHKVDIDENLLLSENDATKLSPGSHVRLMSLGNIKINTIQGDQLYGEYIDDDMNVDYPKMQWIPQKNAHKIKIFVPKILFIGDTFNKQSLVELDVYTEPHYLKLPEGEHIQFVRFGYCRKESQNQAIYTHK
jgi:glutamyl-tRNA synthetase